MNETSHPTVPHPTRSSSPTDVNINHPLYGLTTEARIESRRRVLAKALAEILLNSRRESNAIVAVHEAR